MIDNSYIDINIAPKPKYCQIHKVSFSGNLLKCPLCKLDQEKQKRMEENTAMTKKAQNNKMPKTKKSGEWNREENWSEERRKKELNKINQKRLDNVKLS